MGLKNLFKNRKDCFLEPIKVGKILIKLLTKNLFPKIVNFKKIDINP